MSVSITLGNPESRGGYSGAKVFEVSNHGVNIYSTFGALTGVERISAATLSVTFTLARECLDFTIYDTPSAAEAYRDLVELRALARNETERAVLWTRALAVALRWLPVDRMPDLMSDIYLAGVRDGKELKQCELRNALGL